MMKITLYTNAFMHDGKRHVSATVMVRRGEIEIVGCFGTSAYATADGVWECAFQTATTARSMIEMFENIGIPVEVEAPLAETTALIDLLHTLVSE